MALKRIQKELLEFQTSCPDNITANACKDTNLFEWNATITGPTNTPYCGGIFLLKIIIPPTYPFSPPDVKFVTKIFHPNVSQTGYICLDVLKKEAWSPALSVAKILLSISSLLADPNTTSPLDSEAAEMYMNNRNKYDNQVKEWVKKYASAN